MEKIMPCPVCGCSARIIRGEEFGFDGGCFVGCGCCGHNNLVIDGTFDTEEEAVRVWNEGFKRTHGYVSEQVDEYLAKVRRINETEEHIRNTRGENQCRFLIETLKRTASQRARLTIDKPDSILKEYEDFFQFMEGHNGWSKD